MWTSGSNSQPASQIKPDRKGIGPLKRDSIPTMRVPVPGPRDIDHRIVGERMLRESSSHPLHSVRPITQVDWPSTNQWGSTIPSPTPLYTPQSAQYIHVRNVLGRVVILILTRGTEPAVPAEECVWAIGLWHVHPLHVRKLPVTGRPATRTRCKPKPRRRRRPCSGRRQQ